jgi:segregation and condensation protein B
VTTRKFLEAFGFASLRDLPDIERLEAEDLLQNGESESDLDRALGLARRGVSFDVDGELDRPDGY